LIPQPKTGFRRRRGQGAPPEATPEPGSGRIVVPEDEAFIPELSGQMLRHSGYSPSTASDGKGAVREYRSAMASGTPFHAVILDLTIPGGMGGKAVVEQLRRIDPGVRAIVSSGYSNDPVMANYREHGFHAAIRKPYRIEELSHALSAVVTPADA
jgi:CheY-like chemotaxis protein